MNNTMEYKDYAGSVAFSRLNDMFYGKDLRIRSLFFMKEQILPNLLQISTVQSMIIFTL